MAPSKKWPINGLKVAVTVALIIFFIFPSTKSVDGLLQPNQSGIFQNRKLVLGSRPPGCVNKCMSCRPCMATLVVPSHQKKGLTYRKASSHEDDDTYYLLSWKCRCGDKIFQP